MGEFSLKDLLQAIGPTASLIFAAWIFLSFLQQRYMSAYEHYRQLIAELRKHQEHDPRRDSRNNRFSNTNSVVSKCGVPRRLE